MQLTESMEDYLEAIAELTAVDGHAHVKEIAEKLAVKLPSVTGALRQLAAQGLIIYNSRYPVQLTEAGKVVADEVVRRHTILKKFFSDILGLPPEQATETACRLEHVVDSDTIERFIIFSEAIENRSDARKLQTYLSEAVSLLNKAETGSLKVLTTFSPGETVIVKQYGRNLSGTEPGLPPLESELVLCGFSLDKTQLNLQQSEKTLSLPMELAENIWAEKL